MISVLGEVRSHRVPNLGWSGAESSGWCSVLPKKLHKMWCMSGHIVMTKLPITSCPQLQPLKHPNSFRRGMLKLNVKFDAGLFLYPLSHFECNSRTVHMLTQRRLAIPLTSTVKSLFTDVHSSPLFLAARLHRCHENYSCYINNCWTFSGQASYVHGPWTWSMVWELPEGVGWGVWVEGGKEGKIGTTVIM